MPWCFLSELFNIYKLIWEDRHYLLILIISSQDHGCLLVLWNLSLSPQKCLIFFPLKFLVKLILDVLPFLLLFTGSPPLNPLAASCFFCPSVLYPALLLPFLAFLQCFHPALLLLSLTTACVCVYDFFGSKFFPQSRSRRLTIILAVLEDAASRHGDSGLGCFLAPTGIPNSPKNSWLGLFL